MWAKIKPYVISILIALAVGGLAAFLTRNSMDLYNDIIRPPLSPPGILFPIVWSVLYVLMGISAAMIYTDKSGAQAEKENALKPYVLSLAFNFGWSIIFFNMRAYLFAFLWLIVLLCMIIITILRYFKINKTAAYLQIPYALWVIFAGYLNFAIWILNK